MLDLRQVERSAHAFEETLVPLRSARKVSGDALIPVAVALNDLREEFEQLKRVVARLSNFSAKTSVAEEKPLKEVMAHIEQLTLSIEHRPFTTKISVPYQTLSLEVTKR